MGKEEKKILNLFKKKNNIFIPAECVLCGNTFEPGEYVYLVDKEDNNSLVCDKCAEEDYKRGGIYRPIKEEEEEEYKLIEQSKKLFKGVKIDTKKEGVMTIFTEGEIKELAELLEKVKKTILTPVADFEGKSPDELNSMRTEIIGLDRKLMRYHNILCSIQNFRRVWDSIKRKDNFEKSLDIYRSRTNVTNEGGEEDDLPF